MHCTFSRLKYNLFIPLNSPKKEPNCTVLLRCPWRLQTLQNIRFASKSYVSHGKSYSPGHTNFHFDEDWCAASNIIASSLESGSFSCLIWLLFRWFSCFWWQKYSDIHNKSNHVGDHRFAFQDGGQAFFTALHRGCTTRTHVSPIKENQIWRPINTNLHKYQAKNYFLNTELFFFL